MTTPFLVQENSFQKAWIKAVKHLSQNHWNSYNLVVQFLDPFCIDDDLHKKVEEFSKEIDIRSPKDVAYTIFPYNQYNGDANELYSGYLDKFYPWTRKREHRGWGTYFERMINYIDKNGKGRVNQLDNIISAINNRETVNTSAYTITITYPGGETIRPLGGPCLNYLTIQMLPGNPVKLGLLAIYRNHEFLERAYGNYLGLCKLLNFINCETNTQPGYITCISSHAFVSGEKTNLNKFMNSIDA
jgi:hypothetical protein